MPSPKNIIMLAAENGALKNGKVGGLADVIQDLPNALSDFGLNVIVITPSYGFLHKDNPSKFLNTISFPFGGKKEVGELWEVTAKQPKQKVKHLVFEHKKIRGDPIYSQDEDGQPFAKDATKFSIFCSAIGKFIQSYDHSTVIHLHDWHTGILFLLRELHPEFRDLKKYKHVFTIHNLGYQGTRPIRGKNATVEQWFPELFDTSSWFDEWKDYRYDDPHFTPMIAAIKYADKINTVSPSYSEEILRKSDHENCFYGGEGLENYLIQAKQKNRLFGILNGIEYPETTSRRRLKFSELFEQIINEIKQKNNIKPDYLRLESIRRLEKYKVEQPKFLLTSITRVTEQKVRILFESGSDSKIAIDKLDEQLISLNGIYILLGNGTKYFEDKCIQAFKKNERFIYLKLYSPTLAQLLYSNGSIFIMPSSFEPCGISQMIAMREGQPCIVHAVGGLKDTVLHEVNGFQFTGNNILEKVDNFIKTTSKAINILLNNKDKWKKIKLAASASKFEWKESAKKYIDLLYS